MKSNRTCACVGLAGRASLIAVLCLAVVKADADTYSWLNGSGNWSSGTNWSPNVTGGPTSADSITAGALTTTRTVSLDGNYTIQNLTRTADTGFWAFTGLTAPRSFTVQGNTTIGDWTLFSSGTSAPLDLNFNGNINVNSDNLRLGGTTSGTATTNMRLNSITVQGITTIASGANLDLYSATSTLGAVVNNGFFSIARAPTGSSGITVSVASLSGSGTTANETLTVNKTNAATLVINGSATSEYTGSLRNGGIGQSLSLTKSGIGTQKLSGTNTYTGKTEVDAGTLIVNGDNASASGAVTVDFGAALGGLGRIGGSTTIDGDLNSGDNSKGTLRFEQGLTLNGTSKTVFEIASLTSFDVLAGDGNHTIKFNDGADVLFDFTGYEAHANDSFLVLSNWYARTGSGLNIAVTNLTSGYSLDTSNLLTNGTIVVVRNPTLFMLSWGEQTAVFCVRKFYSAGGKI